MEKETAMTLSPAAQAVLTAATQRLYFLDPEDVPHSASEHGSAIAAALRAVADQVVPEGKVYTETVPDAGVFVSTEPPARFRSKILAIATELEVPRAHG